MDLGAASFIIIAGWASALSTSPTNNSISTTTNSGRLARRAIMKCGPLLLIGLMRLATNKGLEYQEHVSEYGVHWNFFFTLCLVEGSVVVWKGLKAHFNRTTTRHLPLDFMLAMFIMVPYQIFLSYYGGQEFIEDGSRRCNAESYGNIIPAWVISKHSFLCNIFVANREGILGSLGYMSLRLFSEAIARRCLLPIHVSFDHRDERTLLSDHQQYRLSFMSVSLWIVHLVLTAGLNIPTSRRSTNASFILWALSHNVTLLSLIYTVTAGTTTTENEMKQAHPLLEAINRNGLAVFLSSNILTGLINLTFDTLHTPDGRAVIILTVYLMLVCGFAILLDAERNEDVDKPSKAG
jgi:phosphatidylinositol glycan class W